MKNLPPMNALRALEAVARLGQFTKAADELCVTHGAISKQIKHLEEFYGFRIFIRSTNGMRLTERGEHVHEKVIEALDAIEASFPASGSGDPVGKMSLSVPPRFLASWLIPRLKDFAVDIQGSTYA